MLNPISASKQLKEEYIGYITTSFQIGDEEYAKQFEEELSKEGLVAKGPFLDISDSFKKGKSIHQLITDGVVSPLFAELEGDLPDSKKELPIERTLYLHQENAIRKAYDGRNLVVTTGTGSGKTECFIIPIINHLLKEKENGQLDPGVRAILVYPMNALANDQMKRLRDTLRSYPYITFGLYNGDTEQTDEKGIIKYGTIFKDNQGRALRPLRNEVVSRNSMQERPPHILVTNYAMLEYMLLRPNDDKVFSGAKLRFIVLDEAHTYKGATGMETSLLIRRLKARIPSSNKVLHILTSATLGGKDSDADIVKFAETLCDANFAEDDIIRSETEAPKYEGEPVDYPYSLFEELANPTQSLNGILDKYQVSYDKNQTDEEILFDVCLNSSAYHLLRKSATHAMTVQEIAQKMNEEKSTTQDDVVNLISIISKGEKNKTVLLKARYHMFVRALEGAYITIGKDKKLLLERELYYPEEAKEGETIWKVFEAVICNDCGRIGICGRVSANHLEIPGANDGRSYFLVEEEEAEEFDDDEYDEENISENEYILCPICGEIHHLSQKIDFKCGHRIDEMPRVFKATKITAGGDCKCPSCNTGSLRSFYLGYDAATSVLATSLFEQIPETEVVLETQNSTGNFGFFGGGASQLRVERKSKQFLSFSDSRSEAAFFASSMGKYYREFLRRRGIMHVVKSNLRSMTDNPWDVSTLVAELTSYFDSNRSFAEPLDPPNKNLTPISKKQAWIAVLNEMVRARTGTSLSSLGIINFKYKGNQGATLAGFANAYHKDLSEMIDLFDLMVMDFAYTGSIESSDCNLTDEEREYLFYSTSAHRFKLKKDAQKDKGVSNISAWIPNKRKNQTYYYNSRVKRLIDYLGISEDDAVQFLSDYWEGILKSGEYAIKPSSTDNERFYIDASSFLVVPGMGSNPVYRCETCGRITMFNVSGKCSNVKCKGTLKEIEQSRILEQNHYAKLYSSDLMKPLHIREHTAQLGRKEQSEYQEWFIKKYINALSCSTTFEMGVDVGDLETVYLRDMPPSPANYVQRAGRAGRSLHSAAFALTYAKLSSHDFTYYKEPTSMIEGKISVPVFTIQNEKVIQRHIFAVALSLYFAQNPEEYNGNNANVFLNENGYERFKDFLNQKPAELREILKRSIPDDVCDMMGIDDFSWTDRLIGEDGVLTIAIDDYNETIRYYQEEHDTLMNEGKEEEAVKALRKLKNCRRSPEDGASYNELIEFLARNNVLPKYGFPIDAVQLYQNTNYNDVNSLQIIRDLQLAISEYAPDSKVVADNKMYTSRYIRKLPQRNGQEWELYYIAQCPSQSCQTWNWRRVEPSQDGEKCIACQRLIEKVRWKTSIEPRKGFIAEPEPKDVPLTKPERSSGSDACYIGDPQRHIIDKYDYRVNGTEKLFVETTSNDSLMVICNSEFFVCDRCGYATKGISESDSSQRYKKTLDKSHNSPRGKKCKGKLIKRMLSHTFKTDVVRIVFASPRAKNKSVMLSVMYALLEATAKVLDIERSDINGCLHRVKFDGRVIHSIVLYDAVAGGAGHVRRLVNDNGDKLQEVIKAAIDLTKNCTCSPSCYNCLRNYYNQKYHDILSREEAFMFLENFCGEMAPYEHIEVPEVPFTTTYTENETSVISDVTFSEGLDCSAYSSWNQMQYNFPDGLEELQEMLGDRNIPIPDRAWVEVTDTRKSINSMILFKWDNQHLMIFDEEQPLVKIEGWTSLHTNDVNGFKLAQIFA